MSQWKAYVVASCKQRAISFAVTAVKNGNLSVVSSAIDGEANIPRLIRHGGANIHTTLSMLQKSLLPLSPIYIASFVVVSKRIMLHRVMTKQDADIHGYRLFTRQERFSYEGTQV